MPPHIQPTKMHLLDVTVFSEKQELNMAKYQIVNLQDGKEEADAVNVRQLNYVDRKFDEAVNVVNASITSHGNRLDAHDSQITTIEALANHPQIGHVILDRRMDNIETAFGLGTDGASGTELLEKIKAVNLLINNVADSDIATTLSNLFKSDVELGKIIDIERERATNSEHTISTRLNDESTARIAEDGLIRLDYTAADKALEKLLSDAIKAENSRATSSENNIENNRKNDLSRALAAEDKISKDLEFEREERRRSEDSLSNLIDQVDKKHDSKTEEVRSGLDTKIEDYKKKLDEVDTALGQKIGEVDAKHDAKTDELEVRLDTKIEDNKKKSEDADAALEAKIGEHKILLDLEDAKIREEVSQKVAELSAEFNGALTSSNENLGLQIKNVADTLASLMTKLFGKNERFVGDVIIKEAVLFEVVEEKV
jgi:hypothetical protein